MEPSFSIEFRDTVIILSLDISSLWKTAAFHSKCVFHRRTCSIRGSGIRQKNPSNLNSCVHMRISDASFFFRKGMKRRLNQFSALGGERLREDVLRERRSRAGGEERNGVYCEEESAGE